MEMAEAGALWFSEKPGARHPYEMPIRRPEGLLHEKLTHSIIGGFLETHRELGPGFPEGIYVSGLERELRARGHKVAREVAVRVYFKGQPLAWLRLDMLVDEKIIIEAKAHPVPPLGAIEQLRGYLRATRLEVGLLLHFGPRPRFQRVYIRRP